LFTADNYVGKKYLLYSIAVYSWPLCWQEFIFPRILLLL